MDKEFNNKLDLSSMTKLPVKEKWYDAEYLPLYTYENIVVRDIDGREYDNYYWNGNNWYCMVENEDGSVDGYPSDVVITQWRYLGQPSNVVKSEVDGVITEYKKIYNDIAEWSEYDENTKEYTGILEDIKKALKYGSYYGIDKDKLKNEWEYYNRVKDAYDQFKAILERVVK